MSAALRAPNEYEATVPTTNTVSTVIGLIHKKDKRCKKNTLDSSM